MYACFACLYMYVMYMSTVCDSQKGGDRSPEAVVTDYH